MSNTNFSGFGTVDNTDNNVTFDFNTPIVAKESKGGFVLLPPGEYPFVIVDVEKTRYEPKMGSKLPACPQVITTLEVVNEDTNESTTLKYNLFYVQKMMFRVDDLFIGVGKAQEGEQYIPNPDMLVGATGVCKIKQVPGYNDPKKIFNEIDRIIRHPKA